MNGRHAFPKNGVWQQRSTHNGHPYRLDDGQEGMTLREWYIGKALAGLAASSHPVDVTVEYAFRMADMVIARLVAEREKGAE